MVKILKNPSQPCTVLMPVYNGSKFLERSILNIKLGLRDFDELLIINDGSDDLTESEFKKFSSYDSRIRIINRRHSGLVSALNFGISMAKHEFIARADVDDLYSRNRLVAQSNFLNKNTGHAAVFCDYEIIDMTGKSLGKIPSPMSPQLTKLSLLNSQRTPHPGVMFRKSMVLDVGGYLKKDFPAEDLSLWMRLSNKYDLGSIPQVLLFYTLHEASISSKKYAEMKLVSNRLKVSFANNILESSIEREAGEMLSKYNLSHQKSARKMLFIYDLMTFKKMNHELNIQTFIINILKYSRWFSISSIYVLSKFLILRFKKRSNE